MPQILVHAGPDKTGTTAIQRFCRGNGDFLRRFGVEYPYNGNTYNHRWLTAAFLSDKELLPVTRRADDSMIRHKTREAKQIVEHASSVKDPRLIVLSHEGLHVLTEVELDAYREYLLWNGRPVRLLYYVRDPLDYARSAMSQRVLAGRDPAKPAIPVLDHQTILGKYVKVFGKEQVEVRIYGEDVLIDFLVQLGIDRLSAMKSVPVDYRQNLSLSGTGLEVGARLIRMLMEYDAYPDRFRYLFADKLREIPGPPISLTNAQIREIDQHTRDSIDYLAREFDIRMQRTAPPALPDAPDPSECMRIAQDLFDKYIESVTQVSTVGVSVNGSIGEDDPIA